MSDSTPPSHKRPQLGAILAEFLEVPRSGILSEGSPRERRSVKCCRCNDTLRCGQPRAVQQLEGGLWQCVSCPRGPVPTGLDHEMDLLRASLNGGA